MLVIPEVRETCVGAHVSLAVQEVGVSNRLSRYVLRQSHLAFSD